MKHSYFFLTLVGFLFSYHAFAQVSPAWAPPPKYSSTGVGTDVPSSIVVDGGGNVFVGGNVQEVGITDKDWLIVKYNVNGQEVWHRQLSNAGDDYLLAMKIDALGNIYATGRRAYSASGGGKQANYYTIKISNDGATLWDRYYSAKQGSGFDQAMSIALDASGNVYITGQCESPRTSGIADVVTIKYASNITGTDLTTYTWATETDGGGDLTDVGKFIGTTTDGFLYVAGYTAVASHSFDFYTIKYNAVSGETLWTRKFDGSISLADTVTGLAIDHANNAIITGMARNQNNDFITLKYSSDSGKILVNRKYNYVLSDVPYGIIVDPTNDVYVVGVSNRGTSKDDIIVMKYKFSTNDTTKLWECDFTNPYADLAAKIALGPDTAIYVGGSVTHDSLTGPKYFFGAKINSATGAKIWSVEAAGDSLDNVLSTIAVDNSGSFYLTGKSKGASSDYDFLTQKWVQFSAISGQVIDDLDGDTLTKGNQRPMSQWKVSLYTTVGAFVESTRTTADGYYSFKNLGGNAVTYDVVCDSQYPYNYLSAPGFGGVAQAVMGTRKTRVTVNFSSSEGISLANNFYNLRDPRYSTVTQEALVLEKPVAYKPGRKPKSMPTWGNVRDTAWRRTDLLFPTAIGKLYGGLLIGIRQEPTNTVYDYCVIEKKYKLKGGVWLSTVTTGKAMLTFLPTKKVILASGHLHSPYTAKCFNWVPKRNSGGLVKGPKFTKNYNHLAGEQVALRVNMMASDIGTTPEGFPDLIYYDSTNLDDRFNGLAISDLAYMVDSALTYCDAGFSYDSLDTILTKINHAFAGSVDTLSSSPLKIYGNVRLENVTFLHPAAKKKERFHYAQDFGAAIPDEYSLEQNYPNPFNPVTNIRFTLPEESIAGLKIYNILGQEVLTVFQNEQFDAGTFQVPFDGSQLASGVYFYRISFKSNSDNREFSSQRKMLLIK